MAYNANYAVRIAKVKLSTRKKPDCLYITFGPKAHVKKYNAVEISIFPNKISFRFFMTKILLRNLKVLKASIMILI